MKLFHQIIYAVVLYFLVKLACLSANYDLREDARENLRVTQVFAQAQALVSQPWRFVAEDDGLNYLASVTSGEEVIIDGEMASKIRGVVSPGETLSFQMEGRFGSNLREIESPFELVRPVSSEYLSDFDSGYDYRPSLPKPPPKEIGPI
ncbi:MAG TPA: hypothetical protein VJJ47_03460 [Candidatus Paceibacterota bacterium]